MKLIKNKADNNHMSKRKFVGRQNNVSIRTTKNITWSQRRVEVIKIRLPPFIIEKQSIFFYNSMRLKIIIL